MPQGSITSLIFEHNKGCENNIHLGLDRLALAGCSPIRASLTSLARIPLQLITTAIDTIIALGYVLASLVYCKDNTFIDSAGMHIYPLMRIISNLYRRVIEILNPNVNWECADNIKQDETANIYYSKGRNCGTDGITHLPVIKYIVTKGIILWDSSNPIVKHLGTRLLATVALIAIIFCRAIDFVIGAVAAAVSIVLLGRCEKLNHIACRGLAILSVITDIFEMVTLIIYPGA